MKCQAQTYSDGSWHCQRCQMSGDNDEKPECLTGEEIGRRTISNIKRQFVNGQKHPSTKKPVS